MELQNVSIQRVTPALPTFGESMGIYLLSGALLVFVGAQFQQQSLFIGLFATEIFLIVSPAFIYAAANHYNLRKTFPLLPISAPTALLSVIIASAGFVLVGMISALQEYILPRSPEYQAAWESVLQKFLAVPFGVTLAVVAVLPGICEELFFRGFILRGVRQRCSDDFAIILVGLLFGAFHFDPYRFLPTSLLGMLFGYMVVKTGSLVPGIIAHAVNNSIAMLLSFAAQTFSTQADASFSSRAVEEQLLSSPYLLAALPVVLVAASVLWLALRALPVANACYGRPAEHSLPLLTLQSDEEQRASSDNLLIEEEK